MKQFVRSIGGEVIRSWGSLITHFSSLETMKMDIELARLTVDELQALMSEPESEPGFVREVRAELDRRIGVLNALVCG
jgi:hypothetical protein